MRMDEDRVAWIYKRVFKTDTVKMISIRRLRRTLVSVVAVLSLLLMQAATAAGVCSDTTATTKRASITLEMGPCNTGMRSNCGHLDAVQAAQCAAQSYVSNEVAPELRIPKPLVHAPSFWLSTFFQTPDGASQQPRPYPSPGLTRITSPSISIRNCCYRI